jgi:hypothetical protein
MTKAMRTAASEAVTKRAKGRATDPGADGHRAAGRRRYVTSGNRSRLSERDTYRARTREVVCDASSARRSARGYVI